MKGRALQLSRDEQHELTVRMLRALRRYNPARGRLDPFLAHAKQQAVNDILKLRQRQKRRDRRTEPLDDLIGTDREPVAPGFLSRLELLDLLEHALQITTPRESQVLHLVVLGCTRDEIAAALKLSRSRVSVIRSTAIAHLRRVGKNLT